MPDYAVKDMDGDVLFTMTADSPKATPTAITAVEDEMLTKYATELQGRGATVQAIASRMGSYSSLVELHSEGALTKEEPKEGHVEVDLSATGTICKSDEEQQIVYGWAYVTHDADGNVNVDKSGEFVDEIAEIEKGAIKFMLTSRRGDIDHTNVHSTDIVESMVFTPEKVAAMGIQKGVLPTGWWIGVKCDDTAWAAYKAGKTSFSIHGAGTRKAV